MLASHYEVLTHLTNFQLAGRLISYTWRLMDAGGVSMKRSMRSWLLENAQHMRQFGATKAELEEESIEEKLGVWPGACSDDYPQREDYLEEAFRRDLVRPRLVFGARVPLWMVADRYLAILLLSKLRRWYVEDEKRHDGQGLGLEPELVEGALRLMGEPVRSPSFSRETLLRESDDRIREPYARSAAAL